MAKNPLGNVTITMYNGNIEQRGHNWRATPSNQNEGSKKSSKYMELKNLYSESTLADFLLAFFYIHLIADPEICP